MGPRRQPPLVLGRVADIGSVRNRATEQFSMSIRTLLSTMAVLLPFAGAMPARAAVAISSSVALTITTPGTIYFGQSVDGFANVTTSDGSTPSGTITFFDGVQSICTISVTQAATCPASTGTGFAVGTHVLTAVYSGDASHLGSTSNAVTVIVLPNGTTVSLTSSANPAAAGQSVVFTATVAGLQAMAPGMVTLFDGDMALGTVAPGSGGVATFSTASLSAGSHSVTASYAGDAGSAASTSTAIAETVSGSVVVGEQDGFSVAVTGSTTVSVGRMTSLLVTVTPQQGFAQPVDLSCADLPSEAACTFAMRTIPSGGGTTTLEVSTIAPHDCGSTTPYFASLAGPMMAGMVLLFLPRQRRGWKGLLIALVAVCGIASLTGCGNCTDLGTRPGSYTIRVVGTAAGGVVTSKVRMKVVVDPPAALSQ